MQSQIESSIQHATDKVAKFGYLNHQEVSDRDITLAGFGYLAGCITEMERGVVRVRLEGKRFAMLGALLGGLLVGLLQALVR